MSTPKLYDLINSAALSMDPQPMIVWGIPADFNVTVDDFEKYETAILILPSSIVSDPPNNNTIKERELAKILILKQSDTAESMANRKWNIEQAEDFGRELYSRLFSLAKDIASMSNKGSISVDGYEFESALGESGLEGYFNIFDSQLDGIGMLLSCERTYQADPCAEGAGKVVVNLVE